MSLIGIHGVLSFVTSQRTQEIGIRMAQGADRKQVMTLVLRPLALVGAVAIVLLPGIAATFFPVPQAAAIDPVCALRSE